ncbi:MAG: hypothetical protein AUJ52_08920 [Elusimicrobia bacterium CG1_02_63_36]|nr:MAG: hypothetical protein AUJ52_08920 [Elusimicrobia bacterium CG1_02_63_36]PIP84341.1 MAG: hypothetical protein COR54_04680 [Elusimicrobia bacterium CG22_combo_CG10-13_8_21_14_all_63_91]PJA17015.1 MAG: hypothetical protein COX66_05790 [Elusimicrobia bacterium CG_4_10_14_0_2_um_filter_63_34]PJB25738.1 MAG: hypothetical protein CO113_07040 [Elusimicrobia bacterium CG_4_9_14_3_um_filter_62_55]
MTQNILARVVLSLAIAANSASGAFAGNIAVSPSAPRIAPVSGPAALVGNGASAATALSLAAPSLGMSLPSLLPVSVAQTQGLAAASAVAETPAAAALARQAPTATARPSVRASAEVSNAAALTEAPSYKAAAAKSRTVGQTVALVQQGRSAPASGINAATLNRLFDFGGRRGSLNGADFSEDAVDAEVDAKVRADAASDLQIAPQDEDEALDLWFGKTNRSKLFDSKISASIRPINNAGSERFWGRYQRRIPIRVIAGGQVQFITRIVKSYTHKIKDLTLEDYKSYYGSRITAKKGGETDTAQLARLERKLLEEIKWKSERKLNAPKVISSEMKVRVLHFLPYDQARDLPDNGVEKTPQFRERKELEIPAGLKDLQRMLPRLVLFDLRLYGDRIPFDVLEDMGKLQKAGMTFVLLSDKTQEEVERMIRRDTPAHQQNDVTRWKLLSLSNDGNTLYGFSGSFEELKASRQFKADEQEILKRAAGATSSGIVVEDRRFLLSMRAKRGVGLEDLKKAFDAQLKRFGMPEDAYALTLGEHEGTPVVQARPTTLARAMGSLIKDLQTSEGLYLNQQHILTVTDDPALQAALPGAMHAAAVMPKTTAREDYIETALAAMLGDYRVNKVGDLAASASSMKSFKYRQLYGGAGGFEYRIYMLMGHVGHTALDWAVMKYNEDGKLPPFEETLTVAREIWVREQLDVTTNMLERPRETTLGYRDAMEARMFTMYEELRQALKLYPIALGTELPNLMVVDRYNKEGEQTHRDIFRGLFDLVVAKEVKGGLEVFVTDFKTGQTPAIQHWGKDLQVQLYDYFSRRLWPTITAPYSLTQKLQTVVSRVVAFIFPRGMQGRTINEFDRLTFEKTINLLMLKMRKHSGNLTEEMMEKERLKAEREARKELKEANKAKKKV